MSQSPWTNDMLGRLLNGLAVALCSVVWALPSACGQVGEPPRTPPAGERPPSAGAVRGTPVPSRWTGTAEELVIRQRRLQQRIDELAIRLRELAGELQETEPEQARRVAAGLEELAALRLVDRAAASAEQIARGEHDEALATQQQLVVDLARVARRLRTGESSSEESDDALGWLFTQLARWQTQQRDWSEQTSALYARRPTTGNWRRADRLALARVAAAEQALSQEVAQGWQRLAGNDAWAAVGVVLGQVRDDLQTIGQELAAGRVDEPMLARQREVESALTELLSALRPPAKAARSPAVSPRDEEEESGSGVPPLSVQLQLLRDVQLRIQQRTRGLAARQAATPADEAVAAEQAQLAAQQAAIDAQLRRLYERP
ncbi:MAG: hypothetical protein U0935_03290 [Pirellulales bacterium]